MDPSQDFEISKNSSEAQPLDMIPKALVSRFENGDAPGCSLGLLTSAMSLRPSTPSSEKEPLRLIKSLSFKADTGMMMLWGGKLLIAAAGDIFKKLRQRKGTRQASRKEGPREKGSAGYARTRERVASGGMRGDCLACD